MTQEQFEKASKLNSQINSLDWHGGLLITTFPLEAENDPEKKSGFEPFKDLIAEFQEKVRVRRYELIRDLKKEFEAL